MESRFFGGALGMTVCMKMKIFRQKKNMQHLLLVFDFSTHTNSFKHLQARVDIHIKACNYKECKKMSLNSRR